MRGIDPSTTPGFGRHKAAARKAQQKLAPRLAELQERLFAEGRKGGAAAPRGRQSAPMSLLTYRLTLVGGTMEFLLARNAVEAYETGERIWGNVQFVQRAR